MPKHFEFHGFDANSHVKIRLKSLISQILSMAPSDSGVRSTIKKVGDEYFGEWKVTSVNGPFQAQAHAKDPELVFESLFGEMSKQLVTWEKERSRSVS